MRLTRREKEVFTRFAEGQRVKPAIPVRRMVREVVTHEPDFFDRELPAMKEAANQVAAVGQNLNQIARAVNRHKVVTDPITTDELQEIMVEVCSIRDQVRRMIQATQSRVVTLVGRR